MNSSSASFIHFVAKQNRLFDYAYSLSSSVFFFLFVIVITCKIVAYFAVKGIRLIHLFVMGKDYSFGTVKSSSVHFNNDIDSGVFANVQSQ